MCRVGNVSASFQLKFFIRVSLSKVLPTKTLRKQQMEIRGERDKEEIILEKFSKNKLILFTPISYFTYVCLLTTLKCQLPSKIRNNSMFDSVRLLSSNVNVSIKEYFFFIFFKLPLLKYCTIFTSFFSFFLSVCFCFILFLGLSYFGGLCFPAIL